MLYANIGESLVSNVLRYEDDTQAMLLRLDNILKCVVLALSGIIV